MTARLIGTSLVAALLVLTVGMSPAEAGERKPAREMTTTLHHDPLQLRVRVASYPVAPTFLQKKTCRSCTWRIVERKKTTAYGRVRYNLDAPETGNWFYRVGTPERAHYRATYSRVAKTFLP